MYKFGHGADPLVTFELFCLWAECVDSVCVEVWPLYVWGESDVW